MGCQSNTEVSLCFSPVQSSDSESVCQTITQTNKFPLSTLVFLPHQLFPLANTDPNQWEVLNATFGMMIVMKCSSILAVHMINMAKHFFFSHFVEKFEKSRHLKKRLAIRKKRSSATPPVSYFINEKNSVMCTTMDPDN